MEGSDGYASCGNQGLHNLLEDMFTLELRRLSQRLRRYGWEGPWPHRTTLLLDDRRPRPRVL